MNSPRYHVLAAVCAAALIAPVSTLPAQTIAITGGKVYPVSGPPIENGTVLIKDGKIVAVGANVTVPSDAEKVDASGKWVTPGLVDAETQLGLVEVGFGAGANESRARSEQGITPDFTSWDGLNPRSVMIPPAREEGVTSVMSTPGGGLIAGQAALIDLYGDSRAEMLLRAPAAMIASIGDEGGDGAPAKGQQIAQLREILQDTRYYQRHIAEFDRGQSRQMSLSPASLAALVPVLDGKVPLLINADEASDIQAAIDLAKEFGIKVIIGGGEEAWEVADHLAAAKIPVLAGAESNIPSSFSTLGARQDNVALLRKAGVQVALIGNGAGDESLFNVRNIRYEAGNAVGYGLSWNDALKAITQAPAEIFGVADKIGTLQAGHEANVVVWDGDPFEFATRAIAVYVRGQKQNDVSRQDLLTKRYETMPPSYGPKP
ncbi:MAG TPA: amidohydrolase family protein [Gemmatimonadaceae bacterium]|nr:amidohydrolase family protein [Gemmatimonadaceae bacterium]